MPDIILQGLTKTYTKGATPAVDRVSLTVPHGEFLCLLGPSGCGKTTILRMIAGIEHASGGTILMDGEAVDSVEQSRFVPPERRRVGLVFQNYALWPHMTVARNVDFGLRLQNVSPAEREARCRDVMTKLKIADYAKRYPAQLSGGQQQRVALARMLALNPDVLLLDEPLSNLDAALRLEMRAELRRIHETFGTTIIFVSHDQWEAMTLATTIAVMDRGQLQQVGTPDEIYARPANRFVAEFIGNPRINMVNLADTPAGAGQGLAAHLIRRLPAGAGAVACGIRPEEIRLVPDVSPDALPVTVAGIMPTGGSWVIELAHGEDRLFFSTQSRPRLKPAETVGCLLPDEALHLFNAEGRRLTIPGFGLSEAA
ncbi:ABC transporter ATP-binding protein [Rhizobium straminoryzae]|uniref:ABC transporter ATP-binding protein n=1 Tax=Rhizobium straminoryzae TaxID=1387186 RepID=A0A549TEP0_9HYPH|nr:ABC transporter ATP-binding protein [Rhizobium straminoryzae]TRL40746.1 ABC transporter ATP-binding protein [Rhizobium straminoryzae]